MKIIFISTMTQAPWGGSEELWSQTAGRLAAEGHEVAALIEKWDPLAKQAAALPKLGVKLRLRDSARGALAKAVVQRLTGWRPPDADQQWVLGQKPDLVVISQGSITDGFAWMGFCRGARLPYLAMVHCNAEICWPTDPVAAALAANYRGAAQVCFVSENNWRMLEFQLGAALPNASVIWNPNNVAGAGLLPWPAEDDAARLACVGRIEPTHKAQDLLFKVLALPAWRARPVQLNLYGTGPCEQTLRQMTATLGLDNVHFRGHVADLAEIWRTNHLLVMPSRQEGVPMTVIEAMSCGRPAVLTDVGRCAELCADGETGFIASAAAVGPLAEALERAWARRAEWPDMGRRARVRMERMVPRDPVGDFCELLGKVAVRGKPAV